VIWFGVPQGIVMAVSVYGRTHGYQLSGFATRDFAAMLLIWLAEGCVVAILYCDVMNWSFKKIFKHRP